MNIVTLNIPGLDWQTGVLAKQIVNDHPAPFRVILAVKKGGSFVARSFLKSYPAELVEFFGEVDLHRPSTKYKKGTCEDAPARAAVDSEQHAPYRGHIA